MAENVPEKPDNPDKYHERRESVHRSTKEGLFALRMEIDPTGVINVLNPKEVQALPRGKEIKKYDLHKRGPEDLELIALMGKLPGGARDLTWEVMPPYLDNPTDDVIEREKRDFEFTKMYMRFLDNGGNIESVRDSLSTLDDKIKFLSVVGRFGNQQFDFQRASLGAFASGAVSQEQIIDALRDQSEFHRLTARFRLAKNDFDLARAWEHIAYKPEDEQKAKESLRAIADFFGVSYEKITEGQSIAEIMENYDEVRKRIDKLMAEKSPAGVCRDIGVYQAWLADKLGIKDSFASTANWRGLQHVINGGRTENGNFYFLNYGRYYETSADNLRDALSEYEQNVLKAVAMTYYVSRGKDKGADVVPVRTRAGEQIIRMAQGRDTTLSEKTREELSSATVRLNDGLDVRFQRYKTDLVLNKETLAGSSVVRFSRIDNSSDQYNTIHDAIAVHAGHQFEAGENDQYGLKLGATYLSGELKAKSSGDSVPLKDVLLQAHPHLADKLDLSDKLALRYAFGMEALLAIGMQSQEALPTSESMDMTFASELAYMDKRGDMVVGLHSDVAVVPDDMRDVRDLTLHPAETGIYVGGKYKGHVVSLGGKVEGALLNFGKDGKKVAAELEGALNDQYFLNLKGVKIMPSTFLITDYQRFEAGAGTQMMDMVAVDVVYYHEKESDHKPEQGAKISLRFLF